MLEHDKYVGVTISHPDTCLILCSGRGKVEQSRHVVGNGLESSLLRGFPWAPPWTRGSCRLHGLFLSLLFLLRPVSRNPSLFLPVPRRNHNKTSILGLYSASLFSSFLSIAAFKVQVRGRHAESTLEPEIKSNENESSSMKWKIKMLYDGECPLCMREVNMLRERNKLYGAIKFVDISSKDYSPEENEGLDYRTVMGRIHAILSDGTVVTDVEVCAILHPFLLPVQLHNLSSLEMEPVLPAIHVFSPKKKIATIANAVYGVWAKYRLQITGRPPLEDILESRKGNMCEGEICKDDKVCRM
ncbi:hypothetical protein Taro_053655 [Colocasia esculenta]|uniref:Thiol-disulfide oxidoreductase DCC n=1 Tax=Colocasia esculenta TaxID=4460 RepID=A0A843XNF5_COLES|nr:hypothetical protein [Colocasia esculenta]